MPDQRDIADRHGGGKRDQKRQRKAHIGPSRVSQRLQNGRHGGSGRVSQKIDPLYHIDEKDSQKEDRDTKQKNHSIRIELFVRDRPCVDQTDTGEGKDKQGGRKQHPFTAGEISGIHIDDIAKGIDI